MLRLSEKSALSTHISKALELKIRIAAILGGITADPEASFVPQYDSGLKQEMFCRKIIVEETFR
jgi:hypothetical protein